MDTTKTSALFTKNLSIGYHPSKGHRTTVAENLNLNLEPGELVCLLGPNGSGKSTLIRTLCGMQAPLAGDILLENKSLSDLTPKQKAQRISVVLTDPVGSGLMTVYALVGIGRHPRTNWLGTLSRHDRERIEWALEAVGASKLGFRYLTELSDGERQKVMIARALAQDTPIILLDEPTAFIDLTHRVELMRLLRDLARSENLAILVSTHDLDLAMRSADKLWLMTPEKGVLDGLPESLALHGDLAATFSSGKLDWDHEQGTFRMHRNPCLYVKFSGSGPAAIWTQRLLARLGYGIDNDIPNPIFTLAVELQNQAPLWKVESPKTSETFTSLTVFANWLQEKSNGSTEL